MFGVGIQLAGFLLAGACAPEEGRVMTGFHDWDDIRAELDDGDKLALARERDRTEEWINAHHLAADRARLDRSGKSGVPTPENPLGSTRPAPF
jgi:hypothetical protein